MPSKTNRPVKKRKTESKGSKTRKGYSSVARTRGAAVSGEMKYFDCEANTAIAACTTTWVAGTMIDPVTTINLGDAAVATPLCLFAPKVSAALNGRIGRKVKVLKIKVHGNVVVPVQTAQATHDSAEMVRLALVLDKQTNSAQMTGAQLFNDASAGAITVHSFQNPNNFGRFRILKEKKMTISDLSLTGSPTAGDVVQGGYIWRFQFSYKFKKPLLVNFNATNGGTVADIVDNSFHIVCGANNITFAPFLQYYSRVSYKE